jgi:cytochrome o ubiquinol oxidase subunit 2
MALLVLTGCQPAVLDPQGFIGLSVKSILIDSLAIMLAIVLPTLAATLGFAWWFRASNSRAVHLPDWEYSGRLELIVWAIPLLVIMLLGGVAWIGSHELDPRVPLASDAPPLEVQVVSLDWKWLFIYPSQHVGSVNQLVIPAGVPVHFSLTSASVMNAFFIPQLGSMIYTMNGMTTQLNLQADKPGTFLGLSSHYSGDGFSDMHFDVKALPAEQFTAWIDATRNTGQTLDPASYAKLARQSMNITPFTFRSVDPGLFESIAAQKLPPGPGPEAGRPDVTVSPRTEQ